MITFFKKNQSIILGIVGLVAALYVYLTYFSGSGTPALSSTDEVSPVSKDLLVTIQNIRTIKLDSTVFTDPVFVSLTDFGVVIPPEAVGRRNPFLPLGSGGQTQTPVVPAGVPTTP